MSKARGLTSYLDDWGPVKPLDGDAADRRNASGTDVGSEEAAYGYPAPSVPFNQDVPLNPEWGMLGKGRGGFGHSEDIESKQDYAAWNMEKADVERGYSSPKSDGEGPVLGSRQVDGSYPQSIPSVNVHDRGAGSDVRAKEFSSTEGREFTGVGHERSSPGKQQLGSREVNG
jgi:hypothetical protein